MTRYTVPDQIPYPDDYNDYGDIPTVMGEQSEQIQVALTARSTAISSLMPLGAIIMYGGTAAPNGWQLCDGTPHNNSALATILGSPNVPDLRNRFVVGVGSSYARHATGGVSTVTLTAAQSGLPAHSHTGDTGNMSANASHAHSAVVHEGSGEAEDGNYLDTNPTSQGTSRTGPVTINAASTQHQHPFTTDPVAAANALQSHENRPPYYALTYIIRVA